VAGTTGFQPWGRPCQLEHVGQLERDRTQKHCWPAPTDHPLPLSSKQSCQHLYTCSATTGQWVTGRPKWPNLWALVPHLATWGSTCLWFAKGFTWALVESLPC